MDTLMLIIFCFLFTSFVCAIVYFGAFRRPSHTTIKRNNPWEKRNNETDFAMLRVRDDRKIGYRNTDYIVFYNPNTEDISRTLRSDHHIPAKTKKKQKTSFDNDLDFNKLSTWIGIILFFSFIIVIATKVGFWLSEMYSWLR